MRIAWRWVLPMVPLMTLGWAGISDYNRIHDDLNDVPDPIVRARIYHGERYGCVALWNSRSDHRAYEESSTARNWVQYHCDVDRKTKTASALNLPGVTAGFFLSPAVLDWLDIPMPATFYAISSAFSFLFWYSIGDWIERRRTRKG